VIDAIEVSDPDDINQIGFTTFSNFAITSGNTNSVFRLRTSDGRLEVARPLFIDWRKTSYTLGTTVSDGANTSAVESVVVDIPKRVEFCSGEHHPSRVPSDKAAGGAAGYELATAELPERV
jgi:hypothetical protein